SEDQALHAWRFTPVLIKCLHDKLDARVERDELIRPGADRGLLEPFIADLLKVLLGHDPAGARGTRVESHKVGPRRSEPDADARGIRDLDRCNSVFQRLGGSASIAFE